MTPLILHIEYLLQHHDCVAIPGIGALIVEHIAARIDEIDYTILPPTRSISLNTYINHDDGLLASSIARSEGISFEQARALMQKEIEGIREALHTEGEFEIGNIGILRLNEEDKPEFHPALSHTAQAAQFGLFSAPMRVKNEDPENSSQINNPISPATRKNNLNSALPVDLPEGYSLRPFSNKNYYIAINKIFAKCAASAAILLIILVSFIVPRNPSATEPVKASMTPVETIYVENAKSATVQNQTPTDSKENIIPASQAKDAETMSAPEATKMHSDEPEAGSYLIVATFHTAAEAQKFIDYRAGGNYPLNIIKGKNVWRVSAAHSDHATLRKMLNSDEFRAAFSEAWIWNAD